MHYEPSSQPPTFRRRRAPIACRLCRKRKIKCITHENPPQGRCERCERKDLKCEYVTVADEEAQVSSSQSSSPELARPYAQLQNDNPYYPNPTTIDPQWSRKFASEPYCAEHLTNYLANPGNVSSHYSPPPLQSQPRQSQYTGLMDPFGSQYQTGDYGLDVHHRPEMTNNNLWSTTSNGLQTNRDSSLYLFGSQLPSLGGCRACGAASPSQCRCHSGYR